MLYLLLGAVYGGEFDGYPIADVLIAGLIGYGCANTAFGGLAITLVIRREDGVLKRLRATPLSSRTYLSAVTTSTLVVFVLQMAATVALGVLVYDASGAASWIGLALAVPIGVAAFAGLGFAAASLIRSAEGSSAVVNLIVLPMAFLSGAFGPTDDFPEVLQAIGAVLPLTYYVDLVEDVYLRGDAIWDTPLNLLVLALWGGAGYAVAARYFRWMPRTKA